MKSHVLFTCTLVTETKAELMRFCLSVFKNKYIDFFHEAHLSKTMIDETNTYTLFNSFQRCFFFFFFFFHVNDRTSWPNTVNHKHPQI